VSGRTPQQRGRRVAADLAQIVAVIVMISGLLFAINQVNGSLQRGTPVSDQLDDLTVLIPSAVDNARALAQAESAYVEVERRAQLAVDTAVIEKKQRLIFYGGDAIDIAGLDKKQIVPDSRTDEELVVATGGTTGGLHDALGELVVANEKMLELAKALDPEDPLVAPDIPEMQTLVNNLVTTAQNVRVIETARINEARRQAAMSLGAAIVVIFAITVYRVRRTTMHRAAARRRKSERRMQALLSSTSEVVIAVDDRAKVRLVSPSIRHILRREPTDLIGRSLGDLVHADDLEKAASWFAFVLDGIPDPGGTRFCLRSGDSDAGVLVEATARDLRNDMAVHGFILAFRDLTAELERERRAIEQAVRDPLLDPPRRKKLYDHLSDLQPPRRGSNDYVGLVMIGVEGVRAAGGDEDGTVSPLLQALITRVRGFMRTDDVIFRTDPWRFAIVMRAHGYENEIRERTRQVLEALNLPIFLEDETVRVESSAGIAYFTPGTPASSLASHSIQALEQAHSDGAGHVVIFRGRTTTRRSRLDVSSFDDAPEVAS
jgi:PAS domain S-box-containing protein